MREISLEQFEEKLESIKTEDIIELFPLKIFVLNEEYRFWWTENVVGYSCWKHNLISFDYDKNPHRAIIRLAQWLVEKQYLNLTLFF